MEKLYLLILVVFVCSNTIGQTKECDCSGPLAKDLNKVIEINYYSDIKDWFYAYFNMNEEQRTEKKRSANASWGLSTVIENLPINTKADASNSNLNQKFRRIEQQVLLNKYFTDEQLNQLICEEFSDNQLTGYIACLNLCSEQIANGLKYSIGGDLTDIFYVQLIFRNNTGQQSITLSENSRIINAEPIDGLLFHKDLSLKNGQSVTQYFKRLNADKTTSISFNFVEPIKAEPIIIPEQQKVNFNIPIGTIIASVLDYQSFLDVNNDKQKNFDIKKSTWAPCDGRQVTGSLYGNKLSTVPDLRGVFLRGINDMRISGVRKVSEIQRNSEDKMAGEFQSDSIKAHSHSISTRIGTCSDKNRSYPYCGENSNGPGGTGMTGGSETRPKNVTVYYYIKIN